MVLQVVNIKVHDNLHPAVAKRLQHLCRGQVSHSKWPSVGECSEEELGLSNVLECFWRDLGVLDAQRRNDHDMLVTGKQNDALRIRNVFIEDYVVRIKTEFTKLSQEHLGQRTGV